MTLQERLIAWAKAYDFQGHGAHSLLLEAAAQIDALTAALEAARTSPDAARCGECGTVWLASSKIDELSELVEPHRQQVKALTAERDAAQEGEERLCAEVNELRAELATALQQCAKVADVRRQLAELEHIHVLSTPEQAYRDAWRRLNAAIEGTDPLAQESKGATVSTCKRCLGAGYTKEPVQGTMGMSRHVPCGCLTTVHNATSEADKP